MNDDHLNRTVIIRKISFLDVVLELNCPGNQDILICYHLYPQSVCFATLSSDTGFALYFVFVFLFPSMEYSIK